MVVEVLHLISGVPRNVPVASWPSRLPGSVYGRRHGRALRTKWPLDRTHCSTDKAAGFERP
jgi:hypothetical protein